MQSKAAEHWQQFTRTYKNKLNVVLQIKKKKSSLCHLLCHYFIVMSKYFLSLQLVLSLLYLFWWSVLLQASVTTESRFITDKLFLVPKRAFIYSDEHYLVKTVKRIFLWTVAACLSTLFYLLSLSVLKWRYYTNNCNYVIYLQQFIQGFIITLLWVYI